MAMTDDELDHEVAKAAVTMSRWQPGVEIGVSGLKRWGGVVVEEFLPQLRGEAGRRVYREMAENDPVVGAMMLAVELSLRQIEWSVTPALDQGDDEDPSVRAVKVADFVQTCLKDMSGTWPDVVSEALEMLPYGWSWSEITYKRRKGLAGKPASKYDDGWWGWGAISSRAQDSLVEWIFAEGTDELLGMRQSRAPLHGDTVIIPLEKSLHFRTTARHGNPEGRSILRNAYRPWYFKRRIEEYEAIGVERDLAGLPIARVPESMLADTASAEDRATIEHIRRTVRLVRRNETDGLVWPQRYDAANNSLFEFGLLTSGGQRTFDTDKIVSRYDQRIAMTTLADFIVLGHEGVGSGIGVSLAGTKVDLFTAGLEAWVDLFAAQFNERAIPKLCTLNGIIDPALWPTLEHGEVKAIDLGTLGKYLTDLAGAGAVMFPDDRLTNDLLQRADLPVPDSTNVDENVEHETGVAPRQQAPAGDQETVQPGRATSAEQDEATQGRRPAG